MDQCERAFDDYIVDGIREPGAGATRYWSSVRQRALELIPPGARVRPGIDYALTEAVRCKSKTERLGVPDARPKCSDRYLETTINLSGAAIVVGLGAQARPALVKLFKLRDDELVQELVPGDSRRLVAFLPHPNARGVVKTFKKNLAPEQLARLRAHLASSQKVG